RLALPIVQEPCRREVREHMPRPPAARTVHAVRWGPVRRAQAPAVQRANPPSEYPKERAAYDRPRGWPILPLASCAATPRAGFPACPCAAAPCDRREARHAALPAD